MDRLIEAIGAAIERNPMDVVAYEDMLSAYENKIKAGEAEWHGENRKLRDRIVDMMNRFHEDGKIGAFGGSNWTAARVREANEYAAAHGLTGFSVTSPHYSLGVQRHDPWGNGCVTATGARRSADREYYRASGIPVIAWSCLCSGVFSGRLRSENWPNLLKMFGINTKWAYGSNDNRERLARCERLAEKKGVTVAQIVIAWMLSDPMTVLPVVSASSPKRVLENAAAADLELTDAENSYLDLSADMPA